MGEIERAAGGRGGDSAAVKTTAGHFSPQMLADLRGPVGRVAVGAAIWREGFVTNIEFRLAGV